jgi:Txe/YoeB family toxin of Txe-Axe toxin-antitoxin module
MVERILKNPKMLDKLKTISNIDILIGPYYDTGTSILIINKKSNEAYKIIDKLEKIANKYGDHRGNAPNIHVLMGKLLGYVCPVDLKDIYKQKQVYSIEYVIDSRTHMEVWCPIEKKNINKAIELLDKINVVLKPLEKTATLNITITNI